MKPLARQTIAFSGSHATRLALAVASVLLSSHFLHSNEPTDKPDLDARARAFVQQMAKGEYDKAVDPFDETMKEAAPPPKLKEIWESVTKNVGTFKRQKGVRADRAGKYDVRFVTCEFGKTELDVKVVFDPQGRISGLFFTDTPKKDQPAPGYVDRALFQERDVTVGAGEWALPGTLSMPNRGSPSPGEHPDKRAKAGPVPALVLVHGSGPQDRDETIGPNKPFRDLAWGLASRGIAVLRYEKRTRAHASRMASLKNTLTLKEETLDDALAALTLLRKTDGVAPDKIVVLGHSLGAMCAPRIAELDPGVAGLILMASNARPLEDVIVEQVTYVLSLNPDMPGEARKNLEDMRRKAAAMKTSKLTPSTPSSELPFGLSAAYWLSVRDCLPTKIAVRLRQPMLIMQGERDYNVTMDDFRIWRKALAARADVTFKSYPRLNHLFMDGVGKARPEEYEKPGHVAQEVIADIAGWVKTLFPPATKLK